MLDVEIAWFRVPAHPIPEHQLTGLVIGCVHRVFNALGPGLPEGPYAGALAHECEKQGLFVQREVPIAVNYDGVIVGTFRADLIINRTLLVELKAEHLAPRHGAQVLTYLRCSTIEVGLLVSLHEKPVAKRFIIRNPMKKLLREPRPIRAHSGSRTTGITINS